MNHTQETEQERLTRLSPFELKDVLIKLARDATPAKSTTSKMLNAGRGNPNWIATTPREAFNLLSEFALTECKRVWDEPDFAGMPRPTGIATRLTSFLQGRTSKGARFLAQAIGYGVDSLGFAGDPFVHELVNAIIGDTYPEPDRMLIHCEKIVAKYLEQELFDSRPPPGRFDYFATEGGTAAMCYLFNSLKSNHVLNPGDTIALGTPIFTPYLEIPRLKDFALDVVNVEASEVQNGFPTWQYPEAELRKLEDPKVKAFFLVNPSNPPSMAMAESAHRQLEVLVRTRRPDLILLTDDVYATFVPGFRSLAATLPRNTIVVYSYSKHFGCTGWRLGAIGIHEDTIIDQLIARQPEAIRDELHVRYESLTDKPEKMKFIDRVVADSRNVALNHTAGLSLPQQVQMALFSLFGLQDDGLVYKQRCREIVRTRLESLARGLGVEVPSMPLRAGYYVELDIQAWGIRNFGPTFHEYVQAHYEPLDIVLALARHFGIVLLNGSGFDGPPWSVRVSLANLPSEDYEPIGAALMEVARKAVEEWRRDSAH